MSSTSGPDQGDTLPSAVRQLVELVTGSPDGMTRGELTAAARSRYPRFPVQRIPGLLAQAVGAGALTDAGGRLRAVGAPSQPEAPDDVARDGGPRGGAGFRVVSVDLECVVRTTPVEPYSERRIFQIGAVRLGGDHSWAEDRPVFERWTTVPDPVEIVDPARRNRYEAEAVAPEEALEALRDYCAGADLLVAHNGTTADFPLLDEECARAGIAALQTQRADSLYLAHVLRPTAESHRLGDIADVLGVPRDGLTAHDAVDDARLLARVLHRTAEDYAGWPAERRDLLGSLCPDSPAWTLVRELADAPKDDPRPWTPADTAAVVGRSLSGRTARRRPPSAVPAGRRPLAVDPSLTGDDARVEATRLAREIHHDEVQPRQAQEDMTSRLHGWIDGGRPALVEAATGTGKSLAVLAAAIDWLSGDPDRTAVIATYTKQLQSQLSRDVAALDAAVPGLMAGSDLVKGSANRLSLRALTSALAEATALVRTPRGHSRGPTRFVERCAHRELLAYLWLRLADSPEPPLNWIAHSVDPVDVPGFFRDGIGAVLPLWLDSLSQRAGGEYPATPGSPLAGHTDVVREALATHRLLLANHALVLAHLDDLSALPGEVLFVIDEAHQLEDAATSALTTSLDYAAVENLAADCSSWETEARSGAARDRVSASLAELEKLLDHEQLPRAAARAFDGAGAGGAARVGSRTVTLASAYSGTSGTATTREVQRLLRRFTGRLDSLGAALGGYAAQHRGTLDFFAQERLAALQVRVAETGTAARTLVDHIDVVLGQSGASLSAPGPSPAAADATADTALDDEGEPGDADGADLDTADADAVDEAEAGQDGTGVPGTQLPLPGLPPVANQVVHAEELAAPEPGLRRYRFRLSSTPVELPADPAWRRFRSAFARTYYVSATLRVSGRWDFFRGRLGLPESIDTLALSTPFRLGEQAELVCFSDFPSWAEQEEGAVRTLAHQLTGYAFEVVRPIPAGERGGWDGGALVLTTAKATAGGIADHLGTQLRKRGHELPVRSALALGNARAFTDFTSAAHGGGFLVGTRGLWQGVDVGDERRLRLVWVNKLPFAPFAAPVVEARRAAVRARAEAACEEDPDAYATTHYYLPLAALQLRQAVGRLIRSERHRGVVVISDRKLAGHTALRRAYRQAFLGSLEPELLRPDPVTGEAAGGNVVPMAQGWARIWGFLADQGIISKPRAEELSRPHALLEQTLLPETRRIREQELAPAEVERLRAEDRLEDEVLRRCALTGGLLRLLDEPEDFRLKPAQQDVVRAVAAGRNVLGLLPTGFGKSFTFQLPALVLPGTTIVVSPLVALMQDQALELNRTIGGAVRALVSPLRESSSRAGKTEVAEQLEGRRDHGIKLVYVSPERLCQRRFRELVREAVAAGRVHRIALDEAHTVVQWDDFRPSMQRVERFLAELREKYGLPVTALTATANRTVHAGLRQGVFGLPAEPPEPGGEEERRERDTPGVTDSLVTVRENPIRPELALFRRSLRQSGPVTSARLAEEVADALRDHAVLYCLTVKEVVALHAHLREYLGDAGVRVRRFHGRLTEAEKAAVMTEFRETPRRGGEGFTPLVVVATAAFGLGIDRDDIRTVFCVSAPTDMAALYQQLGRAGRDVAGQGAAQDGDAPANTGLALLTGRGLRTVAWMTGSDLPPDLMQRMGQRVLTSSGGVLDAERIADDLIGEDLGAGRLTEENARSARTAGAYTTGVVRAFSTLAGLGAVTDLGDFPPLCTVRTGELASSPVTPPPGHGPGDLEQQVVTQVLSLPARAAGGARDQLYRNGLDVVRLDAWLAGLVDGYQQLGDGPAGTWQFLVDLHDRGLLDVSAAPSRRLVTGMEVLVPVLPREFTRAIAGRGERAAREVALLRDYFEDAATCAHRKFADYFGVRDLPDGCCTHAVNRCSACWERTDIPLGQSRPPTATALATPLPLLRGASPRADAEHVKRRLDDQVYRLVWAVHAGVHSRTVWRTLRGEDSWYSPGRGCRVRLLPPLLSSRYFGARGNAKHREVEESLARLAAEGRVVPAGSRWRADVHARGGAATGVPGQSRANATTGGGA